MKKIAKLCCLVLLALSLAHASGFEVKEAKEAKRIDMDNAIYSYNASIKDAIKAVVNISTTKNVRQNLDPMMNDPFFRQFFGNIVPQNRIQKSLGSGVIISSDGYIVTNNHVVEGADKIRVLIPNMNKEYKARIIGQDKESDIAVIKIEASSLSAISFANSESIEVGDITFAIGNPFGVGESVTQGIISALNKNQIGINAYENFIQTDASINPGNSGGALVDTRGALIGINTAILSRSGGNHGVGFAIPANMVRQIATALINTGHIDRGYVGVSIQNIGNDLRASYDNKQGAIVIGIEPGSPAAKAGLAIWDLITSINGKPVTNASALRNMVATLKPNTTIDVSYMRNKRIYNTKLTLGSRKQAHKVAIRHEKGGVSGGLKGIVIDNITDELRARMQLPDSITGVIITDVKPGSPAAALGLEAGSIISQVENQKIVDTNSMLKALQMYKGRSKKILIYTSHGVRSLVVK